MTTLSQKQLSKDVTKSKVQESMINSRQLELYLNILANDVRQSAREVEELLNQFKTRLDQLKTTIQNKTAFVFTHFTFTGFFNLLVSNIFRIPTAQVYPQFMHLATLWFGFQDEMVLLSVISNIRKFCHENSIEIFFESI